MILKILKIRILGVMILLQKRVFLEICTNEVILGIYFKINERKKKKQGEVTDETSLAIGVEEFTTSFSFHICFKFSKICNKVLKGCKNLLHKKL